MFLPSLLLNYFLLFILNYIQGVPCVQVVRFQPDGVARRDTIGVYKGRIDRQRKMDSLSFCARFKVFFLHGRDTFFQLRDDASDNPFMIKGGTVYLVLINSNLRCQTVFKFTSPVYISAELWVERFRPAINARWNFQMFERKLKTNRWYHICFSYNHKKTRYSTYLDGKLIAGLDYDIKRQVWGDYAQIGQGGEVSESFSGELSQINVWDYVIASDEVKSMASCEKDPQGNYISWDKGWNLSNVYDYDEPLSKFCNHEMGSTYIWFSDVPYTISYYLCEALGTHLPLPKTTAESDFYLQLARRTWGNNTRCTVEVVVSINDIRKEGVWVRHYDNSMVQHSDVAWKDGEPNGLVYENCAQIEMFGVADIDCLTRVQCAVCEYKHQVVFSLRGTCEVELRNINFIAVQEGLNQLMFRGYGAYSIKYVDGKWKWMSEISNETIATMVESLTLPNFPMGRRMWTIERQVCKQFIGERMLLLTPCTDDQYSCDDATCINLDRRCDLTYDCFDHSDEVNCDIVLIPADYKNELPPRQEDNSGLKFGLPITMRMSMEYISVDTTSMQMGVSHILQLIWLDPRLTFTNIKVNDSLNLLPYTTLIKLWTPKVSFVNTELNQFSEITLESSMYIKRVGEPSRRDDSAPAEIDMYPGSENPLTINKKYSTKFVCNFNLVLYPFDEQYCDMHFRVISASTAYIHFNELGSFAEYLGSETLVEYTIGKPFILGIKNGEFSELRVRVPLQRLYGYAILNIYTPSLILIIISYVTLFFRPHIFEVRVMAALTALLVVATLFTQVSSSLPKTSYFKMVDVWLLFCIAIIFIIIICHAIIDYTLEYEPMLPLKMGFGKFTKVTSFNASPKPRSAKRENENGVNATAKSLILASKIVVFFLFALFNLLYWAIILI